MKTAIYLATLLLLAQPGRAQLFGPESLQGALLGGLAGGIIGHNQHRQTGEGIAIGAGAGLLVGALVGESRRNSDRYRVGYDRSPTPYYSDSYRPNYTVSGALLGGVAGGVIGHNQGRHTAEGIAIGAGSGLLLGAVADHAVRSRRRSLTRSERYLSPAPAVYSSSTMQPAATEEPIPTPEVPQSTLSGANSLFGR